MAENTIFCYFLYISESKETNKEENLMGRMWLIISKRYVKISLSGYLVIIFQPK